MERNEVTQNAGVLTVIELLNLLKKENCQIDLDKMNYHRIGRASEPSKDGEQNAKFTAESRNTRIASITLNETRPNVSMLFKVNGKVQLDEHAPSNLPKEIETHIWRNYTVVRDGNLNVEELFITPSKQLYDKLTNYGIINLPYVEGEAYKLDLTKVPMINSGNVLEVSAKDYFNKIYESYILKAANKVYNHYFKEVNQELRIMALKDLFGEESAKYLEEVGVTDGGYSPKTELAPVKETYTSTELVVKMKGISSVPSFNAVYKKLTEGKKLNAADALLTPFIDECENKKKSIYDGREEAECNKEFSSWLLEKINTSDSELQKVKVTLAEMRFSVMVGQTWFKEFDSKENCKMPMMFGQNEVECGVEFKESEEEL